MDSIEDNCDPAILPELSVFPSLGGLLSGGPKGYWGRPDPLGQGSPGQTHHEPPEAMPGNSARAWSPHSAFGLTQADADPWGLAEQKVPLPGGKGPLSLERCRPAW